MNPPPPPPVPTWGEFPCVPCVGFPGGEFGFPGVGFPGEEVVVVALPCAVVVVAVKVKVGFVACTLMPDTIDVAAGIYVVEANPHWDIIPLMSDTEKQVNHPN